ncbi:hypothetical protein [Micromonospora thermarum]|uniref:Ribulose 1,5-bisphosphate carboxylase large subunit n=1 Tax=Micromonospora thermarum TaxID=2720024 RepID=A0ABX0ZCU4_9ACTN|nr:hypothetical protein [Micromonospora thermarum]NJP33780.1 hypothetical protein [Micromonospora thermarum]
MAIPLPRPASVVGLTRSAFDSAVSFTAIPARAFAVLDGVEALLTRINGVVDRIETSLDRTDRVLTDAEAAVAEVAVISAAATTAIENAAEVAAAATVAVGEAEKVSRTAGAVVGAADAIAGRAAETVGVAAEAAATAAELLTAYEPALRRGAPMANHFVEQLSHEEVTAAIRLVDELPKLRQHLTADVLPILATLDRVGPDLHDLLDVTRDLKLAVAGIPGLNMLRRRGERLSDEPAE